MAFIRKRGDLQWQASIVRRGYPRRSKTFGTRAKAEAWAKSIEAEMERGTWIDRTEAERATLYECLDRYVREVAIGKKGYNQEMSIVRHFKAHPLSTRTMASIRTADIAAWRDKRLVEVAPSTVTRQLAFLSHVFNTARREWRMESLANPIQFVRKPKLPAGRTRRLLPGELEALLAAAKESPGLPSILILAVETAMRRGEIASLRWENIDLKNQYLRLPDTKNGEARHVPLSTRAVGVLKVLARRLDGRVFELRADSISQAFTRAKKRALQRYLKHCATIGKKPDNRFLLNLRFHDYRHEATSRLFEIGLNQMEAAAISGHRDTRSLKRYTHLNPTELARKLG